MFDPESEAFLRSAPSLEGLAPQALPEAFTAAYAELIAARLRNERHSPSSEDGWTLSRIADVYELITTTAADPSVRQPAAFVSATAQQMLAQSDRPDANDIPSDSTVNRDAVAPEIAAALLFLIAKQFADAADAASRITLPSFAVDPIGRQLVRGVRLLARGRLARITRIQAPRSRMSADLGQRAEDALKAALLQSIRMIANSLLGAEDDPRQLLAQVIELCDGPRDADGRIVSSYPGYQQMARLLHLASDALIESSLVSTPTPPQVDTDYWQLWLRHRAERAPYIWPNHEAPIRSGFHFPGVSAVLVLPTGAGKTTLASMKIASTIGMYSRVLVLAPTHALVEQLTTDFGRLFPALQPTASSGAGHQSISVMTPERCLALMSFQPDSFDDVSLIVFDEAHLLSNESGTRRSMDAMLAVLMLTRRRPGADLLLLSAMLKNGSEIAEWIHEITGRPCLFFDPLWKPSRQARGVVMYEASELESALSAANEAQAAENTRTGKSPKTMRAVARRALRLVPFGLFGLENNWLKQASANVTIQRLIADRVDLDGRLAGGSVLLLPSVNRVAEAIARDAAQSDLKSIIFVNVKSHTMSMARDLNSALAIDSAIDEKDQELWDDLAVELGGLEHAINSPGNVAVSHNGLMLRVERVLAERSFRRPGGAKVIVATPTLAQGMNLPADLAILASEKRASSSQGREPLAAHELMNAAARAGRAGHVANGVVILVSETVLTFKPESPLDRNLIDRLEAILPLDDRSVELIDPLQSILDRLSTGMVNDPDVEYLLNRLRLEDVPESPLAIGFAERSLAGYQARKAGIEAQFQQQVQLMSSLLDQRALDSPLDEALRIVAAQTGLPADLLVALRSSLLETVTWPETISGWVSWSFTWLSSDIHLVRQLFGSETGALSQAAGKALNHELTTEELVRIEAGVHAWISGLPVNVIERSLGSDPQGDLGICLRARQLVTKAIPLSVTFLVGVVALVAKNIDRDVAPSVRLSLDCLVTGVREGFDSPALIAFTQLKGRRGLRVGRHLEFASQPELAGLELGISSLEDLVVLMRTYLGGL